MIVITGLLVSQGLDPTMDWPALAFIASAFIYFGHWMFGVFLRDVAAEQRQVDSGRAEIAHALRRLRARAVRAERVRLAHELHDLVGHALTAVAIQAGVATARLKRGLEPDYEPLAAAARQGTTELRRLATILGHETDITAEFTRITDTARATGQQVELELDEPAGVDPHVRHAVVCVAAEALTNAAKHAAGATVHVRLKAREDRLELAVDDDGGGAPGAPRRWPWDRLDGPPRARVRRHVQERPAGRRWLDGPGRPASFGVATHTARTTTATRAPTDSRPMRFSPLVLLLALALPATAHADSISYIKAGDVWLAEPDGSGAVQLTTQGTYKAASQGDDGTLVAVSGSRIYRLDRATGAVINQINTPLGIGWFGPWEPAVSPDGTKVAYEIRDFNGYPAVAYSNTDGSIQSRPLHTGWTWPAWIDNTWLLHSEKPNALSKDTIVRAVGSPNNEGTPWFGHPGRTPLADVDIKGNLFAGITDDAIMTVFRFSGEPGTGEVEGCFQYEQPTGKFTGPAFSPDARSLVWGEGDGIWRGEMPDLSGGCVAPPSGRLIIPGASTRTGARRASRSCPARRRRPRRPRRRPRRCPSRRARSR